MRPDPSSMSDCHLLDEYLTVYRDGGRRHAEIRAQLESRLAACDALRADLREAMELLRDRQGREVRIFVFRSDDAPAAITRWWTRRDALLAKHEETQK